MKAKITIAFLLLNFICLRLFAQAPPLVYSVENTGANCTPPPLPTKDLLPKIPLLPDPFVFAASGKGRSTAFSDWACRRNEIKRQIENYEIGPKPPRPDTITAAYVPGSNGGTLTVVVVRNGKALTLYSHVNLPAGNGPFPAVIGISLANGTGPATGSIPSNIFTDRNVATIEYVHDQVTQYAAGQQIPHAADPYFLLYPEYSAPGNVGQYSAWIWGVSRLIDGMEIASKAAINPLPIDLSHLAITGCSYAGKMALYSGAFDERIALTIAQENGGGGAPSWRYNHTRPAGTVEDIDNTDYSWFSQDRMRQFRYDSVSYLPEDHHELMAMVLPRALLETGNTDFEWLGNPANYVDAMATKEIYKTFGIGDRFGFYIDGAHGHCTMPNNQFAAVGAFIDKFLLGINNVNTDTVMIRPQTADFDTINYARWYSAWGTAVVLPVQLKTFAVERNGAVAELRWATAAEQNNKGFTVQNSSDGIKWKSIGFVPTKAGGGNSSVEIAYQFSEANQQKAPTYYRLVQTDRNNNEKISETRMLNGYGLPGMTTIYPNPSNTGAVKFAFADAGSKNVFVTDIAGKVVQQYKGAMHSLTIRGLRTGSYLVKIVDETGAVSTHKIVMQ